MNNLVHVDTDILEEISGEDNEFSAKSLCQKMLECVAYEEQYKSFDNRCYYQPYIPKEHLTDLVLAVQVLRKSGFKVYNEIPQESEVDGTYRCTIQITWYQD